MVTTSVYTDCAGRRARGGEQGGFTLVELMIALVLMSILAAVSVPLYRDYIEGQRLRTVSTDLHLALVLARSEAVKRARAVSLQPADDGWQAGWSIPSPEAGDPDILSHSQAGSIAIAGPAQVQFNAFGRALAAVAFEIDVGSGGNVVTNCLTMSTDGRTQTEHGACPDES